ncbi:MAG: hypothetical protein H0W73_07380 [Bacteroidetes bacterium]|nr:hypothetical protein [Bacteroidota bacterium]
MKQLFFIAFFALAVFTTNAQCIRIYVAQKIKEVEIPIERREFEITINDTMKLNLTSTNDGLLGRVSLEKGTYKVKLQSDEYADAIVTDVIVEESRSNNLTINVVPLTAAQIEEKKKPK